jgi:hypothetical protein
MNNDEALRIISPNPPQLVSFMVTVHKGIQLDVFCDSAGKSFSLAQPSGVANIKLCSVTAPDLEGCYGIRRQGNSFVTDDGEEIPPSQLASRLTQYVTDMGNGGAEWGWEFKLSDT